MVERRIELDRRYARKKKMKKLKAKLLAGTGDREKLLYKIKRLSPWWSEASLKPPGGAPVAAAPKAEEPKKKAPPKPKKPAAEKPA
jgi:hypothetical protein